MAKQPKGELVVVGFNYDLLETKLADKVRTAADRIRERVQKTVEDIIEIGNDLLAIKEALPHGQFLPWLRAEFGWSERSAQNFMSVAEQLDLLHDKGEAVPSRPPVWLSWWRHDRASG